MNTIITVIVGASTLALIRHVILQRRHARARAKARLRPRGMSVEQFQLAMRAATRETDRLADGFRRENVRGAP